ncbi:hypothetical protein HDU82_006406 [Entophlyctis luteolus]|nr:hypothetical protein HDU82_006406 [Entophlyctis luteolus]
MSAVSLLQFVVGKQTRHPENALMAAVETHGSERRMLIEVLELLAKAVGEANVPANVRTLVSHHLASIYPGLTASILQRVSDLKAHIEALREDSPPANAQFLTGSQLKAVGLQEDIIKQTAISIEQTRLALVSLLICIAIRLKFVLTDTLSLLKVIQSSTWADPILPPLVIAFIASLQSYDVSSEFSSDQVTAIKTIETAVFGDEPWSAKGLQEVLSVPYCLFLKRSKPANVKLEEILGYQESIEAKVSQSMSAAPFEFIKTHLCSWASLESNTPYVETETEMEIREYSFKTLQLMVSEFFRHMGRVVRAMKNEAEDLEGSDDASKAVSSCGLNQLLSLVYILYRDRPDDGYIFWTDPHLFNFLRFMSDVRSHTILNSYLDILSSFATGVKSAQCALEYLSNENARLSWITLFRSLDFTAKTLASSPDGELHSDEINLQRSYLRLLRQVVKFSEYGRSALYSSPHLQVINTLFSLLNRRISVELKASLLDVIAAFCIPTEKASLSEVAPMVWRHMEQAEIVPRTHHGSGSQYNSFSFAATTSIRGNSAINGAGDGIRFDLEQIESQNQTYPETQAFLTLLNTLLFAFKPNHATGAVDGFSTKLQAPGGINHYVSFVVDDVFLKIHNRLFASVDERWKMIELSLRLMDQCLKSFDLTFGSVGLSGKAYQPNAETNNSSVESQMIAVVTAHPGFSMMLRLLSQSPLLRRLFEIISIDVAEVNKFGQKCPAFASSIKIALRLVLRVLHLQKFVFDIISSDSAKQVTPVAGIDQHLAFYKESVVKIALFVNCGVDDEICLLAINILTVLSQSPVFNVTDAAPGRHGKVNRMVSLLSSCTESYQILDGFARRLEIGEVESLVDINMGFDDMDGVANGSSGFAALKLDAWREYDLASLLFDSVPDNYSSSNSIGLANLIRLAVLDLLLENLISSRRVFPNLGHYLLGYNVENISKAEILDNGARNDTKCCLHAILDLLRAGTNPNENAPATELDIEFDTEEHLFVNHPKLSERCFRLLYLLCSDESTSLSTMRYLRTTENFFFKQLESMPVNCEFSGENSKLNLNIPTLIHQRAWLIRLVALELHVTTLIGQRSHAQKLLDLLFINPAAEITALNRVSLARGPERPLTKVLEILNDLDVSDPIPTKAIHLTYFNDVDLSTCVIRNEYGLPLFDLRQAHDALLSKQREFEKQGNNPIIGQDKPRVKSEIAAILQDLLERNSRIETLGSRIHCISSWSSLVCTAFGNSFEFLPADLREEKSFELLSSIVAKLTGSSTVSNEIFESLARVILTIIFRLKEDRNYQSMLRTAAVKSSTKLPANVETFQRDVLGGLLFGILRQEASPSLRENLYAGLLHYLTYTGSEDNEFNSGSMEIRSQQLFDGLRSRMLAQNLTIIVQEGGDKLLEIVCRDAATSDRVLKTAAFALLEALANLSNSVGSDLGVSARYGEKGNAVVEYLVKRNYLSAFIGVIRKQEDVAIQSLMQADPAPENWPYLYIFESKLSLLLRIGQTRDGVEKLLEAGILEVLIECKFLDERPQDDYDAMDSDKQMEAIEIYHMTAVPVFELILCIVSSFRENGPVIQKVASFIEKHQETFSAILKNKNALESPATRRELELVTGIMSYLGHSGILLELELRGGYSSFHNLMTTIFGLYINIETETRVAERHVQIVLRNLLSYCETVTSNETYDLSRESSLHLVFVVWTEFSQKQDKGRVTINAILKSLSRICDQFSVLISEYDSCERKIMDISRLGVDEVNEIAKRSDIPSIDEFSMQQRQQVAIGELHAEAKKLWEDIANTLHILDNLLILTWRYFEVCVGTSALGDLEESNRRFMRGSGEPKESYAEVKETALVRKELSEGLGKVCGLDMNRVPDENRGNFVQMLFRMDEDHDNDDQELVDSEAEFLAHMGAAVAHSDSASDKALSDDSGDDSDDNDSGDLEDGADTVSEQTHQLSAQPSIAQGASQVGPSTGTFGAPSAPWEAEMEQTSAVGGQDVNRYFEEERKCSFCRKPGHSYRQCKEKETECLLCNQDHDPTRCPLSDVCFACFRMGHRKDECPNHWRKYTVAAPKKDAAVPELRMFCYACASPLHFGDDCREQVRFGGKSRGSAFNLDNLPRWYRDAQNRKRDNVGASAGTGARHTRFNDDRNAVAEPRSANNTSGNTSTSNSATSNRTPVSQRAPARYSSGGPADGPSRTRPSRSRSPDPPRRRLVQQTLRPWLSADSRSNTRSNRW